MPNIAAAQAQKHVTHNEALRVLDVIVQLSVLDRDLTAPPGSPVDGDRYIVGASATGAWAGKDGQIAAWQDNAWAFHIPLEGWICWVGDEDIVLGWDGSAWAPITSGSSVNPTPMVGINATADTTNRLSVSSPASLFSHEGAGHQVKINKNAAADTASFLYQTGFSGRAEIGLAGDDDFHFKVSPDGTNWKDSIVIDKTTGVVTMPFTTSGGAGGSAFPDVIIQDQKPAGSQGGAASAGINIRVLNTLVRNVGTIATLAANQFTLSAGTYRIQATAGGFMVNGHKLLLYNVTDATYPLDGTSAYGSVTGVSGMASEIDGIITIAASKTFELRHWIQIARAINGYGPTSNLDTAPAPVNALPEVFASINIWKMP